jgi:site-specific DNA-methyltransferase (adenine-specific)
MCHYLKILCDLIFGEKNFKNEIIWQRTNAKGLAFTRFAQNHDTIFYYGKSKEFTWNPLYLPHDESYLKNFYKYVEEGTGRMYRLADLTNPNKDRPNLTYEFLGITRVWRWTKERMQKAFEDGLIIQNKTGNVPQLKRYLDEQEGNAIGDNWTDISTNKLSNNERLGYPTQKPEALLERIIQASSDEGDLVADFFCGCGTAIATAEKLHRNWLGVDISHLAIKLMTKRLVDTYGEEISKTFEIHGFPKDIDSAKELANNVKGGRLEFEDWIIEVLLHGITNERRNEMGFDGYRTFVINEKKYIVMMEVKSGNASPTQLNHFIMTLNDKKGAIGIFICFAEQITRNMQVIAKKEGQFTDDYNNTHCDKIQVISVEDLIEGKRPVIPQSVFETFKKAEKKSTGSDTQIKMEL